MKRLLVLGAGTAGTMVANKLRPHLDERDWTITLVDQNETHYYQPGFLFLPFGGYKREELEKPKRRFIPQGVELLMGEIDLVEPEKNQVKLVDGTELSYDYLVIATGTHPTPGETPGLGDDEWRKSVFDFYTIDGAEALKAKLDTWEGGKLVLNIIEMPIKCPVAPLEFIFLADSFFHERGMRDHVQLEYVTPLPGAFTKPVAARYLGDMLEDRKIKLESDFFLERVDTENHQLVSYDERTIDYDLLVTIPVNMGAEYIARSGLGDELRHVPVDKHNFLSTTHDNIFALGDAAASADIESRIGRPLRHRHLHRELPRIHRRKTDESEVRWSRQLLHRVRQRQGHADRLQLRHRAAPRQVPVARNRPLLAPPGDRGEPLGQAHVQVGLLERASRGTGHAYSCADVDGGKDP